MATLATWRPDVRSVGHALPAPMSRQVRRAVARIGMLGGRLLPRTLPEERWLLSTGSPDVLAFVAARLGVPELTRLAGGTEPASPGLDVSSVAGHVRGVRTEDLLELARLAALTGTGEDTRRFALALYDTAIERDGLAAVNRPGLLPEDWWHSQLMTRMSLELGLVGRARELLSLLTVGDSYRESFATDLLHPSRSGEASHEAWLGALNALAGWSGDSAVHEDREAPGSAFDRIRTGLVPSSVDGPSVSIILPCFRPDPAHLRTALRSLVSQTVGDLEILVVDDASGPEWHDAFAEAQASDPRVRLLRQRENRGAYVARNRGLAEATGEYVTFLDSDDWAHPRRIEHQLAPFQVKGATKIAALSIGLRVGDDLLTSYRSIPARRLNLSSLFMRRAEVLDVAGYFVASRKGADSEYVERLQRLFPGRLVGGQLSGTEKDVPALTMLRLTPDSLSRKDLHVGYLSPDRVAFIDSFRHWHEHAAPAAMRVRPNEPSPFPLPRKYRATPASAECFDVVVVFDGRSSGVGVQQWTAAMRRWRGRGMRIGFVHLASPRVLNLRLLSQRRELLSVVADELVEQLSMGDSVRVRTLAIADPTTLLVRPPGEVQLDLEEVLLAGGWQGRPDAASTAAATRVCEEVFGLDVVVAPDVMRVIEGRSRLEPAGGPA